ncbi:MAG: sulfotransferase [Planctomycetota bacterium]|jgi:hypothetical protein
MNIEPPILVVGVPRSGTSVIAGTLAACGVWTGHTIAGSPPNPKGWFENPEIKNRTNKAMLAEAGYDPLGQDPLPPEALDGPLPDISDILESQGYQGGPWLFKDPKTLLCWRAWDRAFPRATWVLAVRRVPEIYASWQKLGWKVQSIDQYSVMLGELVNEKMNETGICNPLIVDVFPGGNYDIGISMDRMLAHLWLKHNEASKNFFDSDLWHERVQWRQKLAGP